jgi:hypothetical protein
MFDLFLGLQQDVEGRAQVKASIAGSRPIFMDFSVFRLCNRYGDVGPWVNPCLGPLCNV